MSSSVLGVPSNQMVGLDTNVILRFILHDDPPQYALASAVFSGLTRESPGHVAHVTLVELAWTLKRHYRMERRSILDVIRRLVRTETIEFEDGECVVRALAAAEEGADFADALIAASGELFGVAEYVTFDRGAAQRLGWRLLEPVG